MKSKESNHLRNDHYLYVLKDKNKVIRYIGHGRLRRMYKTDDRSQQFIEILNDGGVLEKIQEGLTKTQAMLVEREYLEKYLNCPSDEYNLINKLKSTPPSETRYDEIKNAFYYDETSPTFLRWNTTVYSGRGCGLAKYTIGDIAGHIDKSSGYGIVRYNGTYYRTHRVIFSLYYKIDVPCHMVVNHIDSNPSNNNILNLEVITPTENNILAKRALTNSTGIRGVLKVTQKGILAYQAFVSDSTTGQLIRKTFSVRKYGEEQALLLAIQARKELEEEFYTR